MKSAILKRLERRERQQLLLTPLAMDRRLALAHLLLLQAWFWMGKAEEIILGAALLPGKERERLARRKSRVTAHVDCLIGDCLHEIFLVFHLATRQQARADAMRLQDLVRAMADETLVHQAEAQARANLARLISAATPYPYGRFPRLEEPS